MKILGFHAFGHDTAACLVNNGKIEFYVEEERYNRQKHTTTFPVNAIKDSLERTRTDPKQIEIIVFGLRIYRWVWQNFKIFLRYFPKSLNLFHPQAKESKLFHMFFLKKYLKEFLNTKKVNFKYMNHHFSHAASSFFLSPFEESMILTIDGAGDYESTVVHYGKGNKIKTLFHIDYPHSLGDLYATMTEFLGFKAFFDEYKVMGLSAYGKPRYYEQFKDMVTLLPQGRFKLNLKYFSYYTHGRRQMYSDEMIKLLGKSRKKDEKITQRHMDIASTLQVILSESILHVLDHAYRLKPVKNLCMAGGVALNALANRDIMERSPFENFFFQPVAYDAGNALGASLYYYHVLKNRPRNFQMKHVYYGPEFKSSDYEASLKLHGLVYKKMKTPARYAASLLSKGKVVGWFQGRMEVGPRALGNRSILADPRKASMKDKLNIVVKKREWFRPFAPSVLEEEAHKWFDTKGYKYPFMIVITDVHKEKRKKIPAITHVDGTARPQTVSKKLNPLYWQLINEFYKITKVPVVLNTSFNENEPIVMSPDHAIDCFMRSRIDALFLGDFCVERKNNLAVLKSRQK
ncbi:MAG: carbamoyl transferase [Spirochaetes bacterium]|nr:carbamoyl transferase [Spirochaetota bacterium]